MSEPNMTLFGKSITANEEKTSFKMEHGDYAEVLADLGLSKEVLSTVSEAFSKVTEESAKFLKDIALDKDHAGEKPVSLILGGGKSNGSTLIKLTPQKTFTGKVPGTDEPYSTTKYGIVDATFHVGLPRAFNKENGIAASIEADCRAFFEKKNKK